MNLRTNFKLLPILAFALICFVVVSCSKDEPMGGEDPMSEEMMEEMMEEEMQEEMEPEETTVDEDKENIQATLDNMLVCVDDMTSSRAIDVLLRDFLQMSDGEVYNEEWANNLSSNFEDVFDFAHIDENGRFNTEHHTGRYYYDHTNLKWVKVPTINNMVIVQFPTSPELTENNANLVIDKYIDQAITLDGEDVFAPSEMHVALGVDGQIIFELNLDKVTYDENSTFEIPVEIDASLYLDPMTISLDVERLSSTEFFGVISMDDGSSCRMSFEADVTLADDDFENLTEESIEKVHAKLKVGDLTIQSLAGLADLIGQEDPDQSTINSLLDLDVLFKDLKIADLEYDETEENFVLYYKDASSESAANYIDTFLEDMESLIEEFTGEW